MICISGWYKDLLIISEKLVEIQRVRMFLF